MSTTRILRPVFTARRRYSSFFSSKPGGGRYFTAAKAPKSVVPSTISSKADKPASAPAEEPTQDAKGKSPSSPENTTTDDLRPVTSSKPPPPSTSQKTKSRAMFHPIIDHQDLRLQRFFALHCPLVLLTDLQRLQPPAPGSLLELVYPNPVFQQWHQSVMPNESLSVAPADADAETARQISRALTMNIAGSVYDWENTLRRLGFDKHEISMDSTKRKRRKKMKKHKLKKRRRENRAKVKK